MPRLDNEHAKIVINLLQIKDLEVVDLCMECYRQFNIPGDELQLNSDVDHPLYEDWIGHPYTCAWCDIELEYYDNFN